ncbi:unnamed protein product [Calypogeia fissa]
MDNVEEPPAKKAKVVVGTKVPTIPCRRASLKVVTFKDLPSVKPMPQGQAPAKQMPQRPAPAKSMPQKPAPTKPMLVRPVPPRQMTLRPVPTRNTSTTPSPTSVQNQKQAAGKKYSLMSKQETKLKEIDDVHKEVVGVDDSGLKNDGEKILEGEVVKNPITFEDEEDQDSDASGGYYVKPDKAKELVEEEVQEKKK